MLHKETVTPSTLDLIQRLMAEEGLKDFKLVGGTALALMIGHRISVDIDLFARNPFDASKLADTLSDNYQIQNLETDLNTFTCFIEDVKVDCMAHRYPWIGQEVVSEGIRMASIDDIAAMKLNAIVINGSRWKDFVDMYVMLEHRSLAQMLNYYELKYPNVNTLTAYKSLVYHKDVQQTQDMGLLNKQIDWRTITARLRKATLDPGKVFEPETELLIQKTPRQSRGRGMR
jgi:hypothetical protein